MWDLLHDQDDGVSVLLVDDHGVVREGLRLLLSSCPVSVRVVGEAGSVSETHDVLETTHVDVALIDVMLPDGDGIQLCRTIRQEYPGTWCVILTSYRHPHHILAATLAGASGYLSKDARPEQVWHAIIAAARGESSLDEAAMRRALEEVSRESATAHDLLRGLTDQERRVFALVGQGLSNCQIAERMDLTEKTVKNYVSHMLTKLGMVRRTEAAVLAARLAERRHQHPGSPTTHDRADLPGR